MRILKCQRGATLIEFALVALPVMLFIFGLMQTAYIVWVDNLLQLAVNTGSRCGAVQSITPPCAGSNAVGAAGNAFMPLTGTFGNNTTCSASSVGVTGSYRVTIVLVDMILNAKSCYPRVS